MGYGGAIVYIDYCGCIIKTGTLYKGQNEYTDNGDYLTVKTGSGDYFLIDKEDSWVLAFRWYVESGYVTSSACTADRRINIKLHRLLMNPPAGMIIDHVNGDTRDNRKKSLRICTYLENANNKKSDRAAAMAVFRKVKHHSPQRVINHGKKYRLPDFMRQKNKARRKNDG